MKNTWSRYTNFLTTPLSAIDLVFSEKYKSILTNVGLHRIWPWTLCNPQIYTEYINKHWTTPYLTLCNPENYKEHIYRLLTTPCLALKLSNLLKHFRLDKLLLHYATFKHWRWFFWQNIQSILTNIGLRHIWPWTLCNPQIYTEYITKHKITPFLSLDLV